jgi:succinate dehydrogenase/fumarate reductase-like Fe-S protein
MQCQAQDAKFSQLNERIATTQCARQCRQKWDICDFRIPKALKQAVEYWVQDS